jgi:hypothetical protein
VSQSQTFRQQTSNVISVGIVGINFSEAYTSYEGDRTYPAKPAPAKEAPAALQRVTQHAAPAFDELLVLKFRATNVSPYPFEWVDARDTTQGYAAALLRLSSLLDKRIQD